jgi:hypothetical protein
VNDGDLILFVNALQSTQTKEYSVYGDVFICELFHDMQNGSNKVYKCSDVDSRSLVDLDASSPTSLT